MGGAKILSLFDGMACGMLAMIEAGVQVERYVAYEIDKYATKTSTHNFPTIEHRGDVFNADFTEFAGFDWLIGGSPCTYWSIAQKNNRETEASGMGWELFSQYVRALHEAQPLFFLYENNKSMSNAIRQSISETFGFEPICINSALVSAQNRQRLYWVGKRNVDGTYSKCDIEQPEDRGILLRDVLENGENLTGGDKSYALTTRCVGAIPEDTIKRKRHTMIAEPVRVPPYGNSDKARPVTACYAYKGSGEGSLATECFPDNPNKQVRDYVAERICIGEPINLDNIHGLKDRQSYIQYDFSGKSYNSQDQRAYYLDAKHGTLNASSTQSKTGVIAPSDKKARNVYEVANGFIIIKGKSYPIKLPDGFYIIRKLTVRECMRLQTVPEWYEFPVSDSQAYKMLGNGWTVSVIAHLIKEAQ